jgi:hypothetical protein
VERYDHLEMNTMYFGNNHPSDQMRGAAQSAGLNASNSILPPSFLFVLLVRPVIDTIASGV